MTDKRYSKIITFVLIVGTVGLVTYLGLSHFFKVDDSVTVVDSHVAGEAETSSLLGEVNEEKTKRDVITDAEVVKPTVDEIAEQLGMDMHFDDPEELVNQVMKRMSLIDSERGVQDLAKVLGNGMINQKQLNQLNRLYSEKRMKLRENEAVELLGEIKAGKLSRWALYLSDSSEIQLQTIREKDGKWKIDKVMLPLPNTNVAGEKLTVEQRQARDLELSLKDSLNFSHLFLKTLVKQDFEKARMMANSEDVSDAKIAGLCILFEDGEYRVNKQKPLQAVRMTEEMSAFYVNLKSNDDSDAQFSVNTLKNDDGSEWRISEINLDRLLEDYAKKVAGGDVYYTPLIKNPGGGDLLVIYFDFDSEGLTDRTKKQLDIVVQLLKLDNRKKVRLSGHTDGLGSDTYNLGLSEKRAIAVKEYLSNQGIQSQQLVTEALGFSKPRRPELAGEDGADDSSARRANRRTEIYLDF